jgi:hypothetical protein
VFAFGLLAGVMGWANVGAHGQTPGLDAPEPPVIEIWQGNRRVRVERPGGEPVKPPSTVQIRGQFLPPVKVEPPPVTFRPPEPPPLPMPPAPLPLVTAPAPSAPARPADGACLATMSQRLLDSTQKLTDEVCSAIEVCRATVRDRSQRLKDSADAESYALRPTMPAPAGPVSLVPVPAAPAADRAAHHADEPPAASQTATAVWAQVGVMAGAVLVGPMLVILLAALLIRRTGLQFRVEVLNSSPAGHLLARFDPGLSIPTTMQAGATPAESGAATLPESVADEEPSQTGEQFDLGPTYEEEQQAKAEALRQQELAVLQKIFEENVQLQEQIAALEQGEHESSTAQGRGILPSDEPVEDRPAGPDSEA